MRGRIGLATLICGGLLFGGVAVARQAGPLEGEVKAAFLFNFAQFIDWPRQVFAERSTPFTFCVTGDSLAGTLEKTVEGEMLNGHPIAVRRMSPTDGPGGCHLVFVGSGHNRRAMEIIMSAASMPIVTVGDADNFINLGGMIRFTETANRVRFEINPDAAARASLRVSPRLLRLADVTRPRGRAAR